MLGLRMDQEVLGELVKTKAPAVGQLMDQYPGIWTLVVSRWFICLYIDILPIEVRKRLNTAGHSEKLVVSQAGFLFLQTVLRVWDCLFYEGSKVLFRVALTLIIHHQMEILRARSLPDVCECFKQITCGAFTLDCHTFTQVRRGHREAGEDITRFLHWRADEKTGNLNCPEEMFPKRVSFWPFLLFFLSENLHRTREPVHDNNQ